MKIAELLMRDTLPQKKFFNIQEVSSLLNVGPHEVRIYEADFPQIRSLKTAKGQRIYRKQDVVTLISIKHLLKEKKLTVAGAQRVLAETDALSLMDEHVEVAPPALSKELDHEAVLHQASLMIKEEDDEFDDRTHQLYQRCAQEVGTLEVSSQPAHVGEMIKDALVMKKQAEETPSRISQHDYDRAMAILMQSKDSLNEVLRLLERYSVSSSFTGANFSE